MRRSMVVAATAAVVFGGVGVGVATASPGASPDPNPCPEGSSITCRVNNYPPGLLRHCPLGEQRPEGLCVYVGPGPDDRDLHAAARVDPLLCAHLKVSTDPRERALVQTLRCPVGAEVPPVSSTPTPDAPAPVTSEPTAPEPPSAGESIVTTHLPVTH